MKKGEMICKDKDREEAGSKTKGGKQDSQEDGRQEKV